MVDDVLLNRAASLERSIARAVEEYEAAGDRLATDYTRQDALILNLLRACETAIDMAMHVVRRDRLGLPQNSRDAFELLQAAGRIDPASANACASAGAERLPGAKPPAGPPGPWPAPPHWPVLP